MDSGTHIIITESCANMRELAQQALSGKWKTVIVAAAIYQVCLYLPFFILNDIFGQSVQEIFLQTNPYSYYSYSSHGFHIPPFSPIGGLYLLLIAGPLLLGFIIYFMALFRKQKYEYAQIFSGFHNFFKAFQLMLIILLLTALWTLLLVVPGIIAALRYSQAFYILADDPSKGVMQCVKESKGLMKGNKRKYFYLNLSFIGWMILSGVASLLFIYPLVFFFGSNEITFILEQLILILCLCGATAYLQTARVVFYNLLKEEPKARIE